MSQWNSFLHGSYRQARRVVIGVVGFTVLLGGVVLLFTPGPAFVVIPIGLGILAIEFAWAQRWLARIKEKAQDAADRWNGKKANVADSTVINNSADLACPAEEQPLSSKASFETDSDQNSGNLTANEPEARS